MRKRAFLQFVLAALLLFAQQMALTHALSHGPASQQHHSGEGKGSFQAGLCKLHSAYCQVLGGMPASAGSYVEQCRSAEQVAAAALPRLAVLSLAPLSRGPPALL